MNPVFTAEELRAMRQSGEWCGASAAVAVKAATKAARAPRLPHGRPASAPTSLRFPLNLTPRQFAVLLLLLDGLTYVEIAPRLDIRVRAIEGLMFRARQATGTKTNVQLAAMFVRAAQGGQQQQSSQQPTKEQP